MYGLISEVLSSFEAPDPAVVINHRLTPNTLNLMVLGTQEVIRALHHGVMVVFMYVMQCFCENRAMVVSGVGVLADFLCSQ